MEGHTGPNEENLNLFCCLFLLILPANTAISQEILGSKIASPGNQRKRNTQASRFSASKKGEGKNILQKYDTFFFELATFTQI